MWEQKSLKIDRIWDVNFCWSINPLASGNIYWAQSNNGLINKQEDVFLDLDLEKRHKQQGKLDTNNEAFFFVV